MVTFCKFTSFFLLLIAAMAFGSQSYVQCLSALTLSAIFYGLRHIYARQQRKEAEQEASAPSKEDKEVDATPEPEVAQIPAVEPEPDYTQELIDLIDSYPATPEMIAQINALLAKGADATQEAHQWGNALEFAANRGHSIEVFAPLAAAGARVGSHLLSDVLSDLETAEQLNFLLDHGASVTDESPSYDSLLEQAIETAEDPVLLAFIERDPPLKDIIAHCDPLSLVIESERSGKVIQALLDAARRQGVSLDLDVSLYAAVQESSSCLLPVLLAQGANPFGVVEDRGIPTVAFEEGEEIEVLALACPGVLRQRLVGWVLALSPGNENDAFERYCRALDELEDAWRNGYGDPQRPFAVQWGNDANALRALTAALDETTDLDQAQVLVLSGANPFPGGIPGKAWEKAVSRRDGDFIAMLLEPLAQEQADVYLLALGDGKWVDRTMALLGLRRAMRQKLLAGTSQET